MRVRQAGMCGDRQCTNKGWGGDGKGCRTRQGTRQGRARQESKAGTSKLQMGTSKGMVGKVNRCGAGKVMVEIRQCGAGGKG